jgi:hypothetical protein
MYTHKDIHKHTVCTFQLVYTFKNLKNESSTSDSSL